MKGGVGAKPPARGGTPVPHPKPNDYRYIDSKCAFRISGSLETPVIVPDLCLSNCAYPSG
jgi:hypothetical protein